MSTRNVNIPLTVEVTTAWPKGYRVEAGPLVVSNGESLAKTKELVRRQLNDLIYTWHRPETLRFETMAGGQLDVCAATIVHTGAPDADRFNVEMIFTGVIRRGEPMGFTFIDQVQCGTWREAKAHAARRLADTVVDFHDDASVIEACRFIRRFDEPSDERWAQMLRMVGFQRAYRHAERTASFEGEMNIHRWAGDHQNDFIPDLSKEILAS